jgi:hypothetical protein
MAMGTATAVGTGVPFVYDGVPIHARGLTVAALYPSSWEPPPNGAWKEYGHVADCWTHPAFPRHILSKPEPDLVLVAHLSTSTPDASTVMQLGRQAMGPMAEPSSVATYPLSLRLPMRGPGDLSVPDCGFRCRRLWPAAGQPAHIEHVDGIPVELRISGNSVKDDVRLCAELFVGRTHETTRDEETSDGTKKKTVEPRSFIFAGDGRHVLRLQDPLRVKRLTARLMDRLVTFAYARQDVGLDVENRQLTGRRLGRARLAQGVEDIEFDIRLPRPQGTVRYTGDYVLP